MKPSISSGKEDTITLWHKIMPPALLALITTIFYSFSLKYPFQFDDIANITKNFEIRSMSVIRRMFSNRWLGELINRLNYKIGRFDPFYYRTWNLIIHIATGILLFYVVFMICRGLKKSNILYNNSILTAFITSGIFLLQKLRCSRW